MIEKQNEGPSEEPTNPDTTSSPVDIIKPKPKKKKSLVRLALGFVGENIKAAWSYISETHIFKILTSNAVANGLTVTFAILALAGVTATPFGPVVVGVLAGIAFTSVAIKVGTDMMQARSLRHLEKENNLLVKNRDAKEQQVNILKDDPKLANILKDQLFQPEPREGKKSVTQRLAQDTSKSKIVAKSVGKALLKQGLDIGLAIANSIATAGVALAVKIAGVVITLFSFGMEAKATVNVDTVRHDLKKQIDSERDKADTPGYNNVKDLRAQVREQRIQTMALKELISDKNYSSMSPEQIKTRFTEIKDKICVSEKAIITSRNIFVRAAKMAFSLIKDAGTGQNPYSKLNNPTKIVINKPGMEDQPLVEKNKPSARNTSKLSQIAAKLTKQVSKNISAKSSSKVKTPNHHQKKHTQRSSKNR